MTQATPKDLPREELVRLAEKALGSGGSSKVYFKFTCKHCGQRCTLADANMLYENGECFRCGKESPIDMGGFMLVLTMAPAKDTGATAVPVQLAEEGD